MYIDMADIYIYTYIYVPIVYVDVYIYIYVNIYICLYLHIQTCAANHVLSYRILLTNVRDLHPHNCLVRSDTWFGQPTPTITTSSSSTTTTTTAASETYAENSVKPWHLHMHHHMLTCCQLYPT